MKNYQKIIKQRNIKLVFLQFCDIFGLAKGIYLPVSKLDSAIQNGINFDGSSIQCYGKTKNSDKTFFVDTSKFYILPNNILTFFCYIKYKFDSRYNLIKICKKLKKVGYDIIIGAELEFFLFDQYKNKTNLKKLEKVGYFSEINIKKLNALNEIVSILNSQNFNVEAVHHECGKNQYELDFKFGDALEIADKVLIAKQVIKHIAKKHKLYASFMPKPIKNVAGSGMHINLSIWKDGKNLFYNKDEKFELSKFAVDFTNNVAKHIGAICVFACPNVNSYKRLNAHMETPTSVRIGYKDRHSAFRVPKFNENSARVEFRFPDISCQIYLTIASLLLSGFENIFNNSNNLIAPKLLPKNLEESLNYLKQDKLISSLIPKTYFDEIYLQIADYNSQITNYEIKKYL